jgi:hypothetical protein
MLTSTIGDESSPEGLQAEKETITTVITVKKQKKLKLDKKNFLFEYLFLIVYLLFAVSIYN